MNAPIDVPARAAEFAPLQTRRLRLRAPRPADAAAIFARYSAAAEVTRYLGWQRHRCLEDAQAFVAFALDEWSRWPAGPLLIEHRDSGRLLGASGLAFETPARASTGFVLAADAWGRGYASEALRAVAGLAQALGLPGLYALCHTEHTASARVLERGGFELTAVRSRHMVFPNLGDDTPQDVAVYTRGRVVFA